jgi:hypothetical protein
MSGLCAELDGSLVSAELDVRLPTPISVSV